MSLSDRFLPAFLATLENFAERDYFTEHAPSQCPDDHDYYWEPERVRRALIQHVGRVEWPLDFDDPPAMTNQQVIDYVQAFYQFVSKPTESWFHDYCGSSHPTAFDQAAGRYDYTVSINALFTRFDTGLRLQSGHATATGSQYLATRMGDSLPTGGDKHLETLLQMALTEFRSSREDDRWTALRHLADAYERIKSSQVPQNKRRSVAALVQKMSPEEGLAEHLDALLRHMTSLSNDLTIRHHEIGTVEITGDSELIDFLFYSYYNVVRFALLRMHAADEPVEG